MQDELQFSPDKTKGIFSTIRIQQSKPLGLSAHIARLRASALEVYGLALPLDLETQVESAALIAGDTQQLRIEVSPVGERLTISIHASDRLLPPTELRWTTISAPMWAGDHKWVSRPQVQRGSTLFIDNGMIFEADNANAFSINDNVIATPNSRVLPGVARAAVLETAVSLGYAIELRPVSLTELLLADVVLASNSVRGLMQVLSIDNIEWSAQAHPVFTHLQRELEAGGWNIDAGSFERFTQPNLIRGQHLR